MTPRRAGGDRPRDVAAGLRGLARPYDVAASWRGLAA